jgi:hypothetical protein
MLLRAGSLRDFDVMEARRFAIGTTEMTGSSKSAPAKAANGGRAPERAFHLGTSPMGIISP